MGAVLISVAPSVAGTGAVVCDTIACAEAYGYVVPANLAVPGGACLPTNPCDFKGTGSGAASCEVCIEGYATWTLTGSLGDSCNFGTGVGACTFGPQTGDAFTVTANDNGDQCAASSVHTMAMQGLNTNVPPVDALGDVTATALFYCAW